MASTAYDLRAFEAQQPKQKPTPQLRVVKTRRHALAAAFTPKVLSAFALVVTLLSLIVYNQVCLNEVTGQINELNEQINILENEQMVHMSRLENTMSRQSIIQMAEEQLGMVKLDQYQTVHVYLYSEDMISSTAPAEEAGSEGGVLATIGSAIDLVKEYITAN